MEVLQKIGLSVVETVGQPFDPEVMDAIMREPTDKAEDGTVLSEYRKGFKVREGGVADRQRALESKP